MRKNKDLLKGVWLVLFSIILLVGMAESQCSFGYTELTSKVLDDRNYVWTACILNEQNAIDCQFYKAPGFTLTANYTVLTINQLECAACTKTVQPFLARVNLGSNRYQYYCIDNKFFVNKCSQYTRFINQQTLTEFYECSRCLVATPFLISPQLTSMISGYAQDYQNLICTNQLPNNCSSEQTISSWERDPISGVFSWASRRICRACSYGFRLNNFASYCIPSVQMCEIYSLTKCMKCIKGYALAGTRCVLLPDYCTGVDQTSGLCKSCLPGFALSSNYQCIPYTPCTSQQYTDAYGICRQGSVKNCRRYDTQGLCFQCKDGFSFNRLHTQCISIASTQIKCPQNTQTIKYQIFGKSCIPFDINCDDKIGLAQNGCISCIQGYYLWRNKCYRAWY